MLSKENPCHGCKTHRFNREIRAACCHAPTKIRVSSEEYVRLFLEAYRANLIEVEETFDYKKNEMFFIIYLLAACPHLDEEEGVCLVQDTKPKACADSEPGEFVFCVLDE